MKDRKSDGEITILTYNVCIGTPMSFLFKDGTPSLTDSKRLYRQMVLIGKMDPDIICLQEVFSQVVCASYISYLSKKGYDKVAYTYSTWTAHVALAVVNITFWASVTVALVIIGWLVGIENGQTISLFGSYFECNARQLISATIAYFAVKAGMKNSVLGAFLGDSVKGGLLVLAKRSKFHKLEKECKGPLFQSQSGDFLNIFRPRSYLKAVLQRIDTGEILTVLNTHTNSLPNGESDVSRIRQIRQMIVEGIPKRSDGAVIVCGDLNIDPSSAEIKMLLEDKFNDSWAEHQQQNSKASSKKKKNGNINSPASPDKSNQLENQKLDSKIKAGEAVKAVDLPLNDDSINNPDGFTWHHLNSRTKGCLQHEDSRLDYILYRGLKCTNCSIQLTKSFPDIGGHLSDHFGVLATLQFTEDAATIEAQAESVKREHVRKVVEEAASGHSLEQISNKN